MLKLPKVNLEVAEADPGTDDHQTTQDLEVALKGQEEEIEIAQEAEDNQKL